MPGELREDRVLVPQEREANQLYNKGAFGAPQSGGSLLLDLLEATFLAETNRLQVKDGARTLTLEDLLVHAASRVPDFEIRYIVYRDLRARGYIVKPPLASDARAEAPDFHVYPPKGFPGKTPSLYVVRALSERVLFDARAVTAAAVAALAQKKKLLLAIVDEEGDLTYYEASLGDPRGKVPAALANLHATRAMLLADRIVVFGKEYIEELRSTEYYGHSVGFGLQLGFTEALYLMEHAGLRVRTTGGRELPADEFRARARAFQEDFDLIYRVFSDLRERGLVAKTGFKFGTHFRVYHETPYEEHAPYLIHALPPGYLAAWPEISGFVRLAHVVRKRLLFAIPRADEPLEYLQLERTRP